MYDGYQQGLHKENNVNELLGEWEWKDFRTKKKYIYYYERRGKEKLKRNEVWGKERLTPFFLYKWTKQSCSKLNCKQQIPPDWIILRMLKNWVVGLLPASVPTQGKATPALQKSVMGSNLSHSAVCLTLQVLTSLYVDQFLEFLEWRRVRKRTYFWLILSNPCYILVIHFLLFLRGWSFQSLFKLWASHDHREISHSKWYLIIHTFPSFNF